MSEGKLSGVRVVLVNNFPGPGLGGGEVQNLALAHGLIAAGAEVRAVLVPGSGLGPELAKLGCSVEESRMTVRHALASAKVIAGQLSSEVPTVLMGTGYWTNLLVRQASRGSSAYVVNLVGVTPGASLADGGSRLALAVRRRVSRATASRVHAYIAVAEAVAAQLVADGLPAQLVHAIPNGVDVDVLRRQASAPLPPIRPGRPLVVCVARLELVKGVEHLIRAAAYMPDVTLVIAGDGPLADHLREVGLTLGVLEHVSFLGRVSPIAPLLAAADIVVLPSLSEGMPLVALEAMALGRPLVATRVGGTPEVVEDGVTGLLVEPADPAAIAAAVQRLVDDPALARQIGDAGAKRVRARFSVDAMCAAYVDLLTSIIG